MILSVPTQTRFSAEADTYLAFKLRLRFYCLLMDFDGWRFAVISFRHRSEAYECVTSIGIIGHVILRLRPPASPKPRYAWYALGCANGAPSEFPRVTQLACVVCGRFGRAPASHNPKFSPCRPAESTEIHNSVKNGVRLSIIFQMFIPVFEACFQTKTDPRDRLRHAGGFLSKCGRAPGYRDHHRLSWSRIYPLRRRLCDLDRRRGERSRARPHRRPGDQRRGAVTAARARSGCRRRSATGGTARDPRRACPPPPARQWRARRPGRCRSRDRCSRSRRSGPRRP
jgi:hypothetical protein